MGQPEMLRRTLFAVVLSLPLSSLADAADNNARYLDLVGKRKYADAAALLSKAANANNAEAQYRLAVMLRSGLGVRRDEARARKLLKRAAAKGHKQAKALLDVLTALVTTGKQPVQPKPSTQTAKDAYIRSETAQTTIDLAFAAVRPFTRLKIPDGARLTESVTADGKTPLMLAASAGNLQAARTMLVPAGVDSTDRKGVTALHLAAHKGHENAIELLLEHGTSQAAGAGLFAARRCDTAMAGRLRRAAGPKLEEADIAGQAAAFANRCDGASWFVDDIANAAVANMESWSSVMTLAIQRKNHMLLQALLAQGSDPNVPLSGGTTALGLAAAQNDEHAVSTLLGAGADPAALDADGNTPLMLAASRSTAPVLKLLLAHGQDLNLKNSEGKTALYIAVENLNVSAVRLISAAGGAATSRNIARDTPEKLAERLGHTDITAALQGN